MSLWLRRRDLRTHLYIATVIKFLASYVYIFLIFFLVFLLDFIIVTINLIQLLAAILIGINYLSIYLSILKQPTGFMSDPKKSRETIFNQKLTVKIYIVNSLLRRTSLRPALSACLTESRIKGVKKGRDQLYRCPSYKGVCLIGVSILQKCLSYIGVSVLQRCLSYRGVCFTKVSVLQGCLFYKGVCLIGVSIIISLLITLRICLRNCLLSTVTGLDLLLMKITMLNKLELKI